MDYEILKERLIKAGLKVTARRLCVLESIIELNHPTAEEIINQIRKKYPDTATATVYKALNIFLEKKIISKVNTENGIFRYDAILQSHHHLYNSDLNRIEDYSNEELTGIIKHYFERKKIPGFHVEDIVLQIIGRFIE